MTESATEDTATPPLLVVPTPWPPHIPPTKASGWMRARDSVLTIIGWALYIWILREPIATAVMWLAPSTKDALERVFDAEHAVNLDPFLWTAAALVTWLCLAGVRQRKRLRQQPAADQQVPALAPEAQFEKFGVPMAQRSQWQEARIVRVHHDAEGRITNLTP